MIQTIYARNMRIGQLVRLPSCKDVGFMTMMVVEIEPGWVHLLRPYLMDCSAAIRGSNERGDNIEIHPHIGLEPMLLSMGSGQVWELLE